MRRELPDSEMVGPFRPVTSMRMGYGEGFTRRDRIPPELLQEERHVIPAAVREKFLGPFQMEGLCQIATAGLAPEDDPVDTL